MPDINAALIKELRDKTGSGVMDCRRALQEASGDLEKAAAVLHRRGLDKAERLAEREAAEGVVDSYIHPGGRVGVLVEVNCATDFVARNDEFKSLVHEIALQIAANHPMAVDEESLDKDWLESERQKISIDPEIASRPKDIQEKIVQGRLQKRLEEVVLLKQPYVKDPGKTVDQMVKETSGKFGEPIRVMRFARFELGK